MNDFITQLKNNLVSFSEPLLEKKLFKFSGSAISYGDANHNVLVMGGTGSGKTNLLRNGLEELVRSGCSGLVLDVKGDYKDFLLDIAPERTVVIGATGDCESVNLIGGMSCEKLIAYLTNEIAPMHNEKYWGSGGLRDTEFLFRYLKEFSEPTLCKLYDMLLTPEDYIPQLMWDIGSREYLSEPLLRSFECSKKAPFGIINRACAAKADNPRLLEQYEWQTAGILSKLRDFSHNPYIRDKLSAGNDFDIASLVYDQNKIVVIDMPVTEFGTVSYRVSRLARQQLVDAIFSHSPSALIDKGLGFNTFTFLLIDEYQQYINISRGNNASGLYDDNLILDKTRQYGHINLLATQGVSSLIAQTDEESVNSLMQNCRSQVVFSSNDIRTVEHVEKLSRCKEQAQKLLKPEKKGIAYLYTAHASLKQGGVISGLYSCPKNKWLPLHHDASAETTDKRQLNPFFTKRRSSKNKSSSINNQLIVHSGNIVLIATEQRLVDFFDKTLIHDFPTGHYEVANHILSKLSCKAQLESCLSEINLDKGDAVCFLIKEEMQQYESPREFIPIRRSLAKLKARGVVVYSLCNSSDVNYMKRYSDYIATDSVELARTVAMNIGKSSELKILDSDKNDQSVFLVSTGQLAEEEFFSVYGSEKCGAIDSHHIFRIKSDTVSKDFLTWLSGLEIKDRDMVCFIREHSSEIPIQFIESEVIAGALQVFTGRVNFLAGVNCESALQQLVCIDCVTPQEVGYVLNSWDEIIAGKGNVIFKRHFIKVGKLK